MELVAPAGNLEKLEAAFIYGADSVYIGLDGLSLRARADNFSREEAQAAAALCAGKKLYCALNIIFRQADLGRLEAALEDLGAYPFSAFIVSDPGVLPFLRRNFPKTELHLSTQAACSNLEAARFWADQGFSRIIPSRELSLKEIEAIKNGLPSLEIEVFAHGAMCLAYSGRCLLSAAMTEEEQGQRSANSGACAHSCRWKYRLLEEEKRQGSPLGIMEGEGFSLILSSKDLCMVSHIQKLRDAGVDAIKIEGRMKSSYYVAAVCAAYREALDAGPQGSAGLFAGELEQVSHRPYSSGFFFGPGEEVPPDGGNYRGETTLLALVKTRLEDGSYLLEVKNSFASGSSLRLMTPGAIYEDFSDFRLIDMEGLPLGRSVNQSPCRLVSPIELPRFSLILKRGGPRGDATN